MDTTLRTWGCNGVVDIATLLVSELVANAVLHAGTTVAVVIRSRGDRLRIEVQDGNERAPARKYYSNLATTGRGLMLVERMSSDWGVSPTSGGKSVWFELDKSDPPVAESWTTAVPPFDLDAFDELGGFEFAPPSSDDLKRPGGGGTIRGPRLRTLVGTGA